MITLFPIALWYEGKGNSGGVNYPFICWAKRSHPFAGAIMAQEIYESRFKTVRMLAIATPLAAAIIGAATLGFGRNLGVVDIAVAFVAALIPAMLFTGLFKPWARELELRGQAIECEVRKGLYHHDYATAVSDAAEQLTRYDQFKGMGKERLVIELNERAKLAGKWCKANQHMIKRAKKESSVQPQSDVLSTR